MNNSVVVFVIVTLVISVIVDAALTKRRRKMSTLKTWKQYKYCNICNATTMHEAWNEGIYEAYKCLICNVINKIAVR
jgi:hypothetical protein